jgi:hypothetical protein
LAWTLLAQRRRFRLDEPIMIVTDRVNQRAPDHGESCCPERNFFTVLDRERGDLRTYRFPQGVQQVPEAAGSHPDAAA